MINGNEGPQGSTVPTDSTIMCSVDLNGIKNNPITQRDAELSHEMLGLSKYASKGKTARTQPDGVNAESLRIDAT